ncbi:MAG TPA: DEAD/DEAH box helicase, partial [Chitinophagaceae bacterium]|nr:DEAD/DEAH box helicase [Chitinophagaceae bacterium]
MPAATLHHTKGYRLITQWLLSQGRRPFAFQQQCWEYIAAGESGLVNAPTGCGKTFSVFLGTLIHFINQHPADYSNRTKNGLQLLWITPLRALAKDIGRAMEEVITALQLPWQVAIRNGDTPVSERQKQKRNMPEVLIITPESLHLLLAQKGYPALFSSLQVIAVDEWHELLGSKRGVQTELALSRIVHCQQQNNIRPCLLWGISATIGNLEEAKEVLLSSLNKTGVIVKADNKKETAITAILPDEIE